MSKTEILAELPSMKLGELAEIQAKLDELVGDAWLDGGELSDADRASLDAALLEYEQNPASGCSWAEARARIESKLRQ